MSELLRQLTAIRVTKLGEGHNTKAVMERLAQAGSKDNAIQILDGIRNDLLNGNLMIGTE